MTTKTDTAKYVYRFGNGEAEGDRTQTDLLGGKGANLNEMSGIGLPVPPGYTITSEACRYYVNHDGEWPAGMEEQVDDGLRHIEEVMDKRFGNPDDPLLVSVRSGAATSMPGMMDTVLNLGLDDRVVGKLAEKTSNERFAYDAYRRLVDMFGDVVAGIDRSRFEETISGLKEERGVDTDVDLTAEDMRELVERYKAVYQKETGETIEIPRAALQADEIAETADFFSFGTNDLTQMTFGFSRDDASTFLPHYVDEGFLDQDPFQVLDQEGVGELVQIAAERGTASNDALKVGICGEHGGEPSSVAFCYDKELDYVSCSPFRVPIARLAAAQAALTKGPGISSGAASY